MTRNSNSKAHSEQLSLLGPATTESRPREDSPSEKTPIPKKVPPPKKDPAPKKVSSPEKKDLNKREVRQVLHADAFKNKVNGRSPDEKRRQYAKYRAIKKRAQEFERTNDQYLVLYPASDINLNKKNKFYNMGWNSAIIYCYEIGPRIKRSPVLRHDMDNGKREEKSNSGVCSIADLEKLTELLDNIGIKPETMTGETELVFFKLNRKYESHEIRDMLKAEQKRLDSLNKLLYAKVLYPDIHRQILELKRIIPPKVKNLEKTYREMLGAEIIRSLMNLIRVYTQMAHGDLDEKEGARQLLLDLDIMLGQISLFNELKLWEVSACTRVGAVIVGARQLIKGRIVNK